MQKRHRIAGNRMMLFIISLSLLICTGTTAAADREQTLQIGYIGSDIGGLDPARNALSQDLFMIRNIFSGLVKYKPGTIDFEPDLAKSWEISSDGVRYTFHLREDVNWHKDFGKFKASDVKYTFERNMDTKTASPWRKELEKVEKIETPDDYTVIITLEKPYPAFLHTLVGVRQGAIVSQKAIEQFGKDAPRNPIGTGPFVMEKYTPRDRVVLASNHEYYAGPPKLSKAVMRFIPEQSVALMALQRGELHFVEYLPNDENIIRELRDSGVIVDAQKEGVWLHLTFNIRSDAFSDVRVRRAVAHGINRDDHVKAYAHMAQPFHSLVPLNYWGQTEDIPKYEYSPERAKALLKEAGKENLTFTITYTSIDIYERFVTTFEQQMRDIGVIVKMDPRPAIMKAIQEGVYIECGPYVPARAPDADIPLTQFWLSDNFPPGLNFAYYKNPKVDELIVEARHEANESTRRRMYREIQQILAEDVPGVGIIMINRPYGVRPEVKGVEGGTVDPIWCLDLYSVYLE